MSDRRPPLKNQIKWMREGCAVAYQLLGAAIHDGFISSVDAEKVLDNFSALASGRKPPHEWSVAYTPEATQ